MVAKPRLNFSKGKIFFGSLAHNRQKFYFAYCSAHYQRLKNLKKIFLIRSQKMTPSRQGHFSAHF
jgi:hypothetical protein